MNARYFESSLLGSREGAQFRIHFCLSGLNAFFFQRIIEEQLTSFSRQSNALDLCLSFMPLTRDPYVLMFLVNLIEGKIGLDAPRS